MTNAFRPAAELLKHYAEYHRDRRNIATHLLGVPMTVFALGVLLSRPAFAFGSWVLSPAWLVYGVAGAWYLTRGEPMLGLAATAGTGLLVVLAHQVGAGSVAAWLACGLGFLLIGWLAQFVGHYYEGRRPAFADDPLGLTVGPLFVVVEVLTPLGLFKRLAGEIERHAGPTTLRNLAHPA